MLISLEQLPPGPTTPFWTRRSTGDHGLAHLPSRCSKHLSNCQHIALSLVQSFSPSTHFLLKFPSNGLVPVTHKFRGRIIPDDSLKLSQNQIISRRQPAAAAGIACCPLLQGASLPATLFSMDEVNTPSSLSFSVRTPKCHRKCCVCPTN